MDEEKWYNFVITLWRVVESKSLKWWTKFELFSKPQEGVVSQKKMYTLFLCLIFLIAWIKTFTSFYLNNNKYQLDCFVPQNFF